MKNDEDISHGEIVELFLSTQVLEVKKNTRTFDGKVPPMMMLEVVS